MKYCLLCFLLLMLFSCSSTPVPKQYLQPDKMTAALKDIIKVDEYINNYVMIDSTINVKERRSLLYAKVFKLHHLTREQFYSSYYYYTQHPDLQKSLFDSLTIALKKQEYKKAVEVTPTSDSVFQ